MPKQLKMNSMKLLLELQQSLKMQPTIATAVNETIEFFKCLIVSKYKLVEKKMSNVVSDSEGLWLFFIELLKDTKTVKRDRIKPAIVNDIVDMSQVTE